MNQIAILSIEDEPEVREAIRRDLRPFEKQFRIEVSEDISDAREAIAQIEQDGDRIGLVLADHRLPGETGVDFLTKLHADGSHYPVRKVLLTGQADQQDTIRAINEGGLHHYIAKPWEPETLVTIVRDELTEYVLRSEDIDAMPYVAILDGPRLLEKISHGSRID
ncbi:response regulator [Haloferula sp. A504]|uniref:response regulator n=1 Tax=Haloferula sp. A504 TaxID=3373601 RepID=UPI0031C5774F|nr:response regulator [Verrucomicrobiaceae bacterium E54]